MFDRILPYILWLCLSLLGCDWGMSEGSEEFVCTRGPIDSVLLPLEVGNYWQYELRNARGDLRDSIRYEVLEEIRHANYPDDLRLFVLSWHSASTPPNGTREVYSNQPDGTHLSGLINDADTAAVDFLRFPYPAPAGTVFYSYSYRRIEGTEAFEVTDSTRYELVATDEVIETPAGTFSTYVYKRYDPPPLPDIATGDYVYFHYAPGIGMVARIIWPEKRDRIGNPDWRYLLTDYCVMSVP